jgi:hypothetical protein
VLDAEEARLVHDSLDPGIPRAGLLQRDLAAALKAYDDGEPPVHLPDGSTDE